LSDERAISNPVGGLNQSITLNIGDISQLRQVPSGQSQVATSGTPMQRLLKAAKEHGGTLSIAQATMYTELEPQEVKQLLLEAEKSGLTEISNDSKTGAIRYHFDV
jgi:hypothetical protein